MARELHDFIPETARIAPPALLFATYRDGWSMESLLAKTCDKDAVIILIKAAKSQYVLSVFCVLWCVIVVCLLCVMLCQKGGVMWWVCIGYVYVSLFPSMS
jgi:hypothetical protein